MSSNLKDDLKGDINGGYYDENGEAAVTPTRDWSVDEERRAKRK
jgi:hypothetical protein